jgi:hypothetical protein
MSEELHRDVGRHDQAIIQLQVEVKELHADVRAIRDVLLEAKGGWRTLMLVAGAAGAAGALGMKLAATMGLVTGGKP